MFPRTTSCLRRHFASCIAASVCSIFLIGCTVPRKIEPGFVADRWSTTLSAFNIDPIFLPRQVHLGDVYLAGDISGDPATDANRWKRRTLYLGRASVRDAIQKDTQTRLRLPGSTVANPSDDIFEAPLTTTALRPVAFPGFNVSEIRETDFAAAFPLNLFRMLFGASTSGNLVMSISIPRAEYEEVPGLDAWEAFGNFCWKEGEPPVCAASNVALQRLFDTLKLREDKSPLIAQIGMVTSVYYARQINYFYNTGRASAFGASASLVTLAPESSATSPTVATSSSSTANAAPATSATAQASTKPAGATAAPAGAPATSSATTPAPDASVVSAISASTETAALQQQVQALQTRLDEFQKKAEGADKYGSLRVVSSTREGTLLSQTFEKPVAIGYRAIWIYPLGYKRPPAAPVPPPQLGK